MSETLLFAIGAVIFAITVYGSVMAGGLVLTRQEIEEHDDLRKAVDDLDDGLPTDLKY